VKIRKFSLKEVLDEQLLEARMTPYSKKFFDYGELRDDLESIVWHMNNNEEKAGKSLKKYLIKSLKRVLSKKDLATFEKKLSKMKTMKDTGGVETFVSRHK